MAKLRLIILESFIFNRMLNFSLLDKIRSFKIETEKQVFGVKLL